MQMASKECICDTNIELTEHCKVCKLIYAYKLSKDEIRNDKCPMHMKITICGKPYFVCKECTNEGWINTHGDGSDGHNYNIYTEEVQYYSVNSN